MTDAMRPCSPGAPAPVLRIDELLIRWHATQKLTRCAGAAQVRAAFPDCYLYDPTPVWKVCVCVERGEREREREREIVGGKKAGGRNARTESAAEGRGKEGAEGRR